MPTDKKTKILLVSGEESQLASAGPSLKDAGFEAWHCHSLYSALLAQRSDPRPIVVVDANRIEAKDQEFFSIVREISPDVYVLAVLSGRQHEKMPTLLEMGVDACLSEPYFPAELISILTKEVARSERYIRREDQLEDQLRGLARFANGVAHQVNNPLSVISGWLQVLISDTPVEDPLHNTYVLLQKEAERIEKTVRDLLAFSGQAAPNRALVDVNALLDEILTTMDSHENNGKSTVAKHFAAELPPVLANKSQLKEACRHLVSHARRSTPAGKQVRIKTDSQRGEKIEIRVHDSGPALTRSVQERLFDPFHAIDQSDPSDSVGLCVSYGIVRGLGGHLVVQSKEGKGNTFVMTLPVAGPTKASDS